jgi:hypothetical protein
VTRPWPCRAPCTPPCHLSSLTPPFCFNLVLEHLPSSLSRTMPAPGTGEAGIGQPRTRPERPGVPAMRAHHALNAPEHQLAPSPPSFPTSLPLHSESPRQRLAPRHARAPARALSPPPASKVAAGPVADAASSRAIPSRFLCASTLPSIAMMLASPRRPRLASSRPREATPWTTRAHRRSTLARYK